MFTQTQFPGQPIPNPSYRIVAFLVRNSEENLAPKDTTIPILVVAGLAIDVSLDCFGNTEPLMGGKNEARHLAPTYLQ